MQDTVSIVAVVITRYPDRLYHFLRKAFTLAALQGHDVTHRATQAEVLAAVAPTLIECVGTSLRAVCEGHTFGRLYNSSKELY